jgi:MFS family permease
MESGLDCGYLLGLNAGLCRGRLRGGVAFDWLEPRRLFSLAAVLLGLGFFLCSRITSLWQFYLYYGVIVGTGFTALGFIPHVSLTARWFERRRGLATSLVLA